MIGLIVSMVEVNLSIIAVILMVLSVRQFFKSKAKDLMITITIAYLVIGLSSGTRVFTNLAVGLNLYGDPLYELFLILDYGFLILGLIAVFRSIYHTWLLVKSHGGLKSRGDDE